MATIYDFKALASNGKVVKRFEPTDKMAEIDAAINMLINGK